MNDKPKTGYDDLTSGWEFALPEGRTLRGRRAEGPGPRIHFLSGNGFCGGVYWPMLRRFLPRHALFAHDIEGHGASDRPPADRFCGIGQTVRRVRAVIEAQGLDRAPMIGMGHSFGGALTVKLAADHPGLFKALVLLDPILFPPPVWLSIRFLGLVDRHPFAQASRKRRTAWKSRQDALDHLRGRGIYKGWTEEALACFVAHAMRPGADGSWELACPRELEAQIFERPVYPWPALKKLDLPVLYLRGASSYSFFEWSERMTARVNRRVELQQLPGGHCFMQEDPAAAHQAIQAFLDRHP